MEETNQGSGPISPFLYLGIFIFILPVILGLIGVHINFLGTAGIIIIVLGVIHTIFMRK